MLAIWMFFIKSPLKRNWMKTLKWVRRFGWLSIYKKNKNLFFFVLIMKRLCRSFGFVGKEKNWGKTEKCCMCFYCHFLTLRIVCWDLEKNKKRNKNEEGRRKNGHLQTIQYPYWYSYIWKTQKETQINCIICVMKMLFETVSIFYKFKLSWNFILSSIGCLISNILDTSGYWGRCLHVFSQQYIMLQGRLINLLKTASIFHL